MKMPPRPTESLLHMGRGLSEFEPPDGDRECALQVWWAPRLRGSGKRCKLAIAHSCLSGRIERPRGQDGKTVVETRPPGIVAKRSGTAQELKSAGFLAFVWQLPG